MASYFAGIPKPTGHLAESHPFGERNQGYGLGARVITDLGESSTLGSVGCFGWDGAATTNVRIDPKEQTVAIVAFQQTPTDPDIIDLLTNGYYAALND